MSRDSRIPAPPPGSDSTPSPPRCAPNANVSRRVGKACCRPSAAAKAVYHYTVAVNGSAAWLTPARALAGNGLVLTVRGNRLRKPRTGSSLRYIGTSRTDKGSHANGLLGEDVIVGVIGTGVRPERPSFADDGICGPPPGHWDLPLTGIGTCAFGNVARNPTDAAFGGQAGLSPGASYHSARDDDGHGSYKAETAAGNAGVDPSAGARSIGRTSGVAPRARLAADKACHDGNAGATGLPRTVLGISTE